VEQQCVKLQQRRFQLQKRAQQFVKLDNVAFAVAFVGINDPTPAISGNGAAIAPRPTGSTELVSNDFPRNRFKIGRLKISVGDEVI
jgi:hypothetical protein